MDPPNPDLCFMLHALCPFLPRACATGFNWSLPVPEFVWISIRSSASLLVISLFSSSSSWSLSRSNHLHNFTGLVNNPQHIRSFLLVQAPASNTLRSCRDQAQNLSKPSKMLDLLPRIPYPASGHGHWSPVTATLDWCEEVWTASDRVTRDEF